MEYHSLVTGLPVIHADDSIPRVTVRRFEDDYMPQLSASDRKLVSLYLLRYDNRNLLSLLAGKDEHDERGIYSRQELQETVDAVRRGDSIMQPGTSAPILPIYIYDFISWHEAQDNNGALPEDELSGLYFRHALSCGNTFVRQWFEFERNMNNLITVFTGQRHGFDARRSLIGEDEVTEAMRTSALPDFGLSTSLDYFGEIKHIASLTDVVESERQLDALKWKWLTDGTFFHYFTVEKIFAYVIQCDIIERWYRLDADKGQEVFRGVIADISADAELPEEFKDK